MSTVMADPRSRKDYRYADDAISAFLAEVHTPHDEALQVAFEAHERHGIPPIQVGPAEGKMLALWLKAIGARKVVEIGTLAGYSAIWMARALPEGGKLWTIDNDPKHAEIARANLERAALSDRVEVCLGDGLEILDELTGEGPFCAVFIDADKARYDRYGRWAIANLRSGGLLLGDNAYLFGQLLEDDARGAGMRRFHQEAAAALESVCAPTPDGLLIARKS